MSVYAHEFSGPHDTPASGTPVTATGVTAQTLADTGAFTPADADALYVAIDGHSASGTVTENVAPGDTDWTLSNDHESGVAAEPGSMVFFIRSGSAVARRSAWTIPSSTFWAAILAGFKPAVAAEPAAMASVGPGQEPYARNVKSREARGLLVGAFPRRTTSGSHRERKVR
jgi:hypothetical protein